MLRAATFVLSSRSGSCEVSYSSRAWLVIVGHSHSTLAENVAMISNRSRCVSSALFMSPFLCFSVFMTCSPLSNFDATRPHEPAILSRTNRNSRSRITPEPDLSALLSNASSSLSCLGPPRPSSLTSFVFTTIKILVFLCQSSSS